MATVTSFTKERILQIEAATVVDGTVDESGHLILVRHDETTIDAGSVIGPTGPTGPTVSPGTIGYTELAAGQRWEAGDFKWSMQPEDHAGWLKMDGRNNFAKVGGAYANLFSVIGTSLGAGINSDTFGIGNVSKKVVMGKAGAGVGSTLGGTGGSADAILVSHSHSVNNHNHGGALAETAEHTHSISHGHTADDNDTGNHQHGIAGDVGNRYVITHSAGVDKGNTAGGGTQTPITYSSMDSNGHHNHDITVTAHSGNSGGRSGTHTHGISNEAPGTNSQGVSAADANLPPFLVMNGFIHI